MQPEDKALIIPCGRCATQLYPVYAQKADGSLVFPPRVIEFQHPAGVVCKRPRTVRGKRVEHNTYLEAVQ
jgi:hypothetical protein